MSNYKNVNNSELQEIDDQTFNINFLKLRIRENVQNFQNDSKHRYSLLYAALDIRYVIEKIMDVYLVLVNKAISKTEAKQYQPDSRIRLIRKYENYLDKKIEYIKLIGEINNDSLLINQKIPDLNFLSKNYGLINDFLHLPKDPETKQCNFKWWQRLETLLVVTYNYISDLTENPIGMLDTIKEDLKDYVHKFCIDEISRDELKKEMLKHRQDKND